MRYGLTCVLVLVLTMASVAVALPALPATKTECVAKGGKWVASAPDTVGAADTTVREFCIVLAPDAGKPCSKDSECAAGKCVYHPDANGMCEEASGSKGSGCEEMMGVQVDGKRVELTCR